MSTSAGVADVGVPSGTHMPGLTGLRGVAVSAVVAYHLGLLPGGYLGVDLFFVLSGFLITTLLLARTPAGPGDLRRWWTRRFTRLTPAVAVVVFAVLVAFATRSGIVVDAIATLTWWQNWHLIAEGVPYWAGSPSPLRHAWSLSIEEQFYLVWPLSVMAMTAFARRRRRLPIEVVVAVVSAVAATASFVWAAVLAQGGAVELSRIYFGTDTRAGALLLGCCAAALVRLRPTGHLRNLPGAAAAVGGVGLVALSVLTTPEQRWIYTGGLALAAFCALALILVSARPGPLAQGLSWQPLQWLGTRSYAIYLWSWPVQVLLEQFDLARPAIVLLTVVASLVLASVSLRLVEDPMRHGTEWARRLGPRRNAWFGGAVAIVVAMVVAANVARPTAGEQVAEEFERLPDPVVASTTTTVCVPPPPSEPTPTFTGDTTQFDRSTVERPVDPSGTPICTDEVSRVLVVGDSTGRGAVNGLRRLGSSDLEVWDRTDLGCGLVSTDSGCTDWRATWRAALDEVRPEVVLAYMRTSDDLVPGDDPEFTSAQGAELRRAQMAEASDLLASTGARVVWVLPATPLERGAFYCEGERTDSACDPEWVAQWRTDLAWVAAERGLPVIDAQQWIDGRPATLDSDRPDGLHFSGPALDAHAGWLAEQLRGLT